MAVTPDTPVPTSRADTLREAWEDWMASDEAPDANAASDLFARLAIAVQDIAYGSGTAARASGERAPTEGSGTPQTTASAIEAIAAQYDKEERGGIGRGDIDPELARRLADWFNGLLAAAPPRDGSGDGVTEEEVRRAAAIYCDTWDDLYAPNSEDDEKADPTLRAMRVALTDFLSRRRSSLPTPETEK